MMVPTFFSRVGIPTALGKIKEPTRQEFYLLTDKILLPRSTPPFHTGSGRNLKREEHGSVSSLGIQDSQCWPTKMDRPERGMGVKKKKDKNCKLVILGHTVKPRHLCNAARFIFRTKFMRFRKGAYKHHSMLQTILYAFWPEPITLKASIFFITKPTPPTYLPATGQQYNRHFSPN